MSDGQVRSGHVWLLEREHFPIGVDAAPRRSDALRQALQRQWDVLRKRNPKFFDGPLLTVQELDEVSGRLRLQCDSYMAYAVQPEVETGVTSVGVTAVVRAQGAGGMWRYLFGQRGSTTHMYPGLWELGPSGAMQPPAGNALSLADARQQLQVEIAEEIGLSITLDETNSEPLCIMRDEHARSVDLVMRVTLGQMPRTERNWEYQACAWVSLDEFAEWARSHAVIAPTASIVQWITAQAS